MRKRPGMRRQLKGRRFMGLNELKEQQAQLQASLEAWLRELEKTKEQIIMHRGQLILVEEWIKRLNTEAVPQ
jgi:hypothetical protein